VGGAPLGRASVSWPANAAKRAIMDIPKHRLINALFILGLPFYGAGFYIGARQSFSLGMVVSMVPYVLILLVHLLDLGYRGHAKRVVNRVYWVSMLCLLSMASGLWIAYARGFPGYSAANTMLQTLMLLVPFNAAVVVQAVNRDRAGFDFARLFLVGLVALIGLNYVGYAGGLSNLVHAFPGRVNLPFMRGLYDASHLLSVINIMLLFHIKDPVRKPVRFLGLSAFYMLNLAVIVSVNGRLSFLVFLVLTFLFVMRMARARFLFPLSFFALPLVLSFALLLYEVLTLPVFSAVLTRVSKSDITTFNGRSYLWYGAWEWLLNDRRGFFFGSGYNGQYWLGLLDRVGVIWDVKRPVFIHMHSSSLQILMAQGFTGLVLMGYSMWYAWSYYWKRYVEGNVEAPLFGVAMYLLFIWQLDIFVYGLDIGVVLLFALLSHVAVDRPVAVGGAGKTRAITA